MYIKLYTKDDIKTFTTKDDKGTGVSIKENEYGYGYEVYINGDFKHLGDLKEIKIET